MFNFRYYHLLRSYVKLDTNVQFQVLSFIAELCKTWYKCSISGIISKRRGRQHCPIHCQHTSEPRLSHYISWRLGLTYLGQRNCLWRSSTCCSRVDSTVRQLKLLLVHQRWVKVLVLDEIMTLRKTTLSHTLLTHYRAPTKPLSWRLGLTYQGQRNCLWRSSTCYSRVDSTVRQLKLLLVLQRWVDVLVLQWWIILWSYMDLTNVIKGYMDINLSVLYSLHKIKFLAGLLR